MKTLRISVDEAAKIMGKPPMFVRMGLRNGALDIGTAIQGKKGRWSYHVSPKKLREYVGDWEEDSDMKEEAK